jgi:hypothetical protein
MVTNELAAFFAEAVFQVKRSLAGGAEGVELVFGRFLNEGGSQGGVLWDGRLPFFVKDEAAGGAADGGRVYLLVAAGAEYSKLRATFVAAIGRAVQG